MSVGSEDSSNAGVEVRWQTCCHLMVWLTPAPQLAGWMLAPEVPRLKTQHRRCRFLSVLMLKARGPSIGLDAFSCPGCGGQQHLGEHEGMNGCEVMPHTCLPFASGARVHHSDST